MLRVKNIKIYPPNDLCRRDVAKHLGIDENEIIEYTVFRRSIDARKKDSAHFVYTVDVKVKDEHRAKNAEKVVYEKYTFPKGQKKEKRPLIVGCGPAGLMCALMLAENGFRPVLIERGASVEERTEYVRKFWEEGVLDENTNVQFGEGGAGTFSDGKLNTGINDVRCRRILEEFVRFGAPENILYDAKPHVGTDCLCRVVRGIRNRIIECGGEVRFKNKLTDILISDGKVYGAVIESDDGEYIAETDDIVLAAGHSAADTFAKLAEKNIKMRKKAFSVGVRIEHKQEMINKSQYGDSSRYFGSADYKLSCHMPDGRGVYTFCMCPGGYVVNSASGKGTVVTNGMSYNARSGENANSAVLVSILPEDIPGDNPMEGFRFQNNIEKKAFVMAGSNYFLPCQKVGDFLKGMPSETCARVRPTVRPGVKFCDISSIFPDFVIQALKNALPIFDRKIKGFAADDALLTAPETRSSSPVRVVRNPETLESVSVSGLYPCGEGAGYAGGIMSAAADGIRCAEAVVKRC